MAGRPTGSGGKAEELKVDEIRRIDKCLTDTRHEHRNRCLFYLGLGSGMRISEIIGLRFKDVAPHGQVVGRVVLEKHRTKSKRSRTVAISRQAIGYLKKYFETLDTKSDDAPLFPSQKNPDKPMNSTWAVQMLHSIFRQAAVPKLLFNNHKICTIPTKGVGVGSSQTVR